MSDLRDNPWCRYGLAAGFQVEVIALVFKIWPTWSAISRDHKWLKPLLIGALMVDLALNPINKSDIGDMVNDLTCLLDSPVD